MSAIDGVMNLYRPIGACRIEGLRWFVFLVTFTAFAVAAPAICHACGGSGSVLLPMHFAVLLAAAVMGVRGGVATALLSPVVSYSLSGMPPAASLVPMAIELATYAAVTGWLVQSRKIRPIFALALALAAGRIVSITAFAVKFGGADALSEHLRNIFFIGLPGIALQLILLPPLAAKIASFLGRSARHE